MRQLLSINLSPIRSPVLAPIHSALDGNPRPQTIRIKTIYFVETMLIADVQTLIDKLRAHQAEIMFDMTWNSESYCYDWDAHPSWNYTNGFFSNAAVTINNTGEDVAGRQISGYARAGADADPSIAAPVCAYLSWVLYPLADFPYSIYRCGTKRGGNAVRPTFWQSGSLQNDVYTGGGAFPWYGPDQLESSGTTGTAPADVDGVASGAYFEVPIPDYAGTFNLPLGLGTVHAYGETLFSNPNPAGVPVV